MTDLEKHLLAELTCPCKVCDDCMREFDTVNCLAVTKVRLDDKELNKDSVMYKYAEILDGCIGIDSDCRKCKLRDDEGLCPRYKYRKLAWDEYEQSGFDTLYSNLINDKDLYDILGE